MYSKNMEQRLTFLTLGVRDLDRMRQFYMETFGWTPFQDQDGIVFFRLNGIVLGLYPQHELADDAGIVDDGAGFKRFSMSINFQSEEEVSRVFDEVVLKGARSIRPPEKVFWGGFRGYIADPEDNYWEIAYNPFLPMDAAGNVASTT